MGSMFQISGRPSGISDAGIVWGELGVRVHFLSFIGSDPQFPEGNSSVTFYSNAEPLSRVATSANPRQPPMNRSVTLPADGGGVRLAP